MRRSIRRLFNRTAEETQPQDKLRTRLDQFKKAFPFAGPAVVEALQDEHPEDWTPEYIGCMTKALKELILHRTVLPMLGSNVVEDKEDTLVSADW